MQDHYLLLCRWSDLHHNRSKMIHNLRKLWWKNLKWLTLVQHVKEFDLKGFWKICKKNKKAGPIAIYCDNVSTIAMTRNPIFRSRRKHIDHHFHLRIGGEERNQVAFLQDGGAIGRYFHRHNFYQKRLQIFSPPQFLPKKFIFFRERKNVFDFSKNSRGVLE